MGFEFKIFDIQRLELRVVGFGRLRVHASGSEDVASFSGWGAEIAVFRTGCKTN